MNHDEELSIRLGHSLRQIPAGNVYFAFADGSLSYDCVTCGSKCCRGYGYSTVGGPELDAQLALKPQLALFVRRKSPAGKTWTVGNMAPACFFLNQKGLCEIHCSSGPGAKPETCRLFPFNDFRLAGNHLVVSPHPALCPLQLVPHGTRDRASLHGTLLQAMAARGIDSPIPRVHAIHRDVDALLALERRITGWVSEAPAGTRLVELVSAQLEMTSEQSLAVGPTPVSKSSFDRYLDLCYAVLGLPSSPPSAEVDRAMVALTPYLRRRFIFTDVERGVPAKSPSLILGRVPYALLSLSVLAQGASLAGMGDLTFQTISRIESGNRSLVALLAELDQDMTWRPDAQIDFSGHTKYSAPLVGIARELLVARRRGSIVCLGDVLCRHNPFDGPERIDFLHFVSGRLAGKISARASLHSTSPKVSGLRRRIQRWGLRHLDDSTLVAAANRSRLWANPTHKAF